MPRTGIMLAKPFEARLLRQWNCEAFYAQPKLNGRRARAVCGAEGYTLLSSEGKTLPSARHIEQQLNATLFANGIRETLDGELYTHGMSLQNIGSLAAPRVNLKAESAKLDYHVFDTCHRLFTQAQRVSTVATLEPFFAKTLNVKRVPTLLLREGQLTQFLELCLSEGFEGIVLRDPTAYYLPKRVGTMLKLKPRSVDSYRITGAFEAIDKYGEPKAMLGGFHLVGKLGEQFSCGAGVLPHSERRRLWQLWLEFPHALVDKFVVLKYQELSERGVPLQPILMEVKKNAEGEEDA